MPDNNDVNFLKKGLLNSKQEYIVVSFLVQ